MKKFVNDPRHFVPEMLEGIQLASDGRLKYEPKYNLIYRADMPQANKVSIIQGSGSGHEPAHTMIVGKGMLDAACPGDVFAGPPVEFVYETTKLLNSPKGVLHIVNNYTGDRLAFEQGREMCEMDGIKVETLLVNDDVAVKDSTWTVGRRGVAGNFFVIKAVGAASEKGASLEELVRIGNDVIANVRTLGIALSSCTPPVKGSFLFEIADDEMEVGIGIHGEPGRQRTKLVSADEIVDIMLDAVVPDLPFKSGDEVALMINGLGGTPIGELYVLYGVAHKKLEAQGIKVFRSYVNEYCTSLEMAGASLTLSRSTTSSRACCWSRPRSRSGSSDRERAVGVPRPGSHSWALRDAGSPARQVGRLRCTVRLRRRLEGLLGVADRGLDAVDQAVDVLPVAEDHHRDAGERQGQAGHVAAAQPQHQRREPARGASGEREEGGLPGDRQGGGAGHQATPRPPGG